MSTPNLSLMDAIAQAADATRRLGIDSVGDLRAIRSFADGPLVIAVAGLPKTGRSHIGSALRPPSGKREVLEIDVRSAPKLGLWDLLVVVTPADRALAQAEEELVRAARRRNRPAAVVVTRADLLGDAEGRRAAQEEIEQFRLAPALSPVGVPWFFNGSGEPLDAVEAFVSRALAGGASVAHEGPARQALTIVLDAAAEQLGDRIAVRNREFSTLQEIEAQQPLALAHADEEVKLARLSVRDALGAAEEALYETGFALASSAVAWVARGGVGDWSDVEQPLRAAWDDLVDAATQALDTERQRFQSEAIRIAGKIESARETVGLATEEAPAFSTSWTTPAFDAAVESAKNVNLQPLFTALEKECRDAVEKDKEDAEERKGVVNRIGSSLQHLASRPLDDRLRTRVHADLEAIVQARLETLVEAASSAAHGGAKGDAAVAADAIRDRILAFRTSLEERHAWGTAYGTLLELRSWVSGGLRSHGV